MSKKIQKIKKKNNASDGLYRSVKIAVPKRLLNSIKLDRLYETDSLHTEAVNKWVDKWYERTDRAEAILSGTATGIMQKDSIDMTFPSAYIQIAGNKMLDILRSHYLNIQDKIVSSVWQNKDLSAEYKFVFSAFVRNIKLFSSFINQNYAIDDVISHWNSEFLAKAKNLYLTLTEEQKRNIPQAIYNEFWEIRKNWNRPLFKGGGIQLDYRVFSIEEARTSTHFNLWLKITTATPHQRISVPFKLTDKKHKDLELFFPDWQTNKRKGILVIKDRHIHISIPIFREKQENIPEKHIGLDSGMTTPASLDSGICYGNNFIKLVENDHDEYLKLQATRNKFHALKKGVRERLELTQNPETRKILETKIAEYERHLSANRWTRLRNKMKSVVKTEIGRTVNLLLKDIDPVKTMIIMEDLSDMNAKEARRSKRGKFDLSSWSRGELQNHIKRDIEWLGGSVAYIAPEYTSQLCNECGWLEEANRKNKRFCCLNCNYTEDADVNAAKNIRERFFDVELRELVKKYFWNKDLRRKKIKELLESRMKPTA